MDYKYTLGASTIQPPRSTRPASVTVNGHIHNNQAQGENHQFYRPGFR